MQSLDCTFNHRLSALVTTVAIAAIAMGIWHATAAELPTHWRLALTVTALTVAFGARAPQVQVKCERTRRQVALLGAALLTVLAAACTYAMFLWITDTLPSATLVLVMAAAAGAGALCSALLLPRLHKQTVKPRAVLIYGADRSGVELAERLAETPDTVQVVGFLDQCDRRDSNQLLPLPLLGSLEDAPRRMPDGRVIEGVIIPAKDIAPEDLLAMRRNLREKSLALYIAAPFASSLVPVEEVAIGTLPCWVVGAQGLRRSQQAIKRAVDIALASVAVTLAAPVLLLCAVAIKLESPGPVIYRQMRYTTGNRLFSCYKLRTMHASRPDETGIRLTQRKDSRVTRIGAFLRRTSLDEVPQFFNVLQGHMSVVGPRPHPPGVKAGERTYEEVVADFSDRYAVKPGITGWAQVSGLRGNTFNEDLLQRRFEHDVEYIRNWSLSFELLIIMKTAWGGFGGENAF